MKDPTKWMWLTIGLLVLGTSLQAVASVLRHVDRQEEPVVRRLTVDECRALCAPNPVEELGGYPVTSGGSCRCFRSP